MGDGLVVADAHGVERLEMGLDGLRLEGDQGAAQLATELLLLYNLSFYAGVYIYIILNI